MASKVPKYALISVYNKKEIIGFSKQLIEAGYQIIATDGTGQELKKQSIPFVSCQNISGNPECFDGYMKTMSFSIEAGMLFDRTNQVHRREAKRFNVKQIDIVVCNFFPVEEIIKKSKTKDAKEVSRNFDFGGPTMVRVAAQNFKNITVIVDPVDYQKIGKALLSNALTDKLKCHLATKAFKYVLAYDVKIVRYLNNK